MTTVKIGWTSISNFGDNVKRGFDNWRKAMDGLVVKRVEVGADPVLNDLDKHLADIYRLRQENCREALEAASELIKRGERRAIRVARLRHVHLSNSKHNRNG